MKLRLIIAIVATLLIPTAGFSLGIRIVDQDPEATARGDAFTATADNASAIYYNPAGITQLQGQNVLLGTYGIYLQSKYTHNGDSVRTKDQPQAAPQFYYTYGIKDTPFTLGIGAYAPYGFGLEYADANPFRTAALKGSVQYFTVNPVIAWRINSTLSVAAGVTLNYANAELVRGVTPSAGNSFTFKGNGYSTGFNLGILWQPAVQHSFGISYHSATIIDLNGHSTLSIPGIAYSRESADTRFEFPDFISAGYSFRPTPDWNLEVDIDWTDWHKLKTLTLNQETSGSISLPFNWQSSFLYEFGVTRYFGSGYHASAGYIYSESSVPNESFSPIVPDSDRHILSAGLGWKNDRYSWDCAYQFAYGPPRTISNGTVADGEYRFISHAITLSIGYHF